MNTKIVSLTQLKNILRKSSHKKIVFTNGCFDILHYGHIKYLDEAKAKGDILVVGLNSDSSVKKLKGKKRPINPQSDRAYVLAALSSVDYVVIFNSDTPLRLIETIKPNILVKGGDWKKEEIIGSQFIESLGGKVDTIAYVKGRSTSSIIKKIENG